MPALVAWLCSRAIRAVITKRAWPCCRTQRFTCATGTKLDASCVAMTKTASEDMAALCPIGVFRAANALHYALQLHDEPRTARRRKPSQRDTLDSEVP